LSSDTSGTSRKQKHVWVIIPRPKSKFLEDGRCLVAKYKTDGIFDLKIINLKLINSTTVSEFMGSKLGRCELGVCMQ
jgi:hypothetical protein